MSSVAGKAASLRELLAPHISRLTKVRLSALLNNDAQRSQRTTLSVGCITAFFARHKTDIELDRALLQIAQQRNLSAAIKALFNAEIVNATEQQPALHSHLRSELGSSTMAKAAYAQAQSVRRQMIELSAALKKQNISDVVCVGIGGSDLGPRLVVDALSESYPVELKLHFVSNVDGHVVAKLMRELDPNKAALFIISKSFSTKETLINGASLKAWLNNDQRIYAVTAKPVRASEYGIPASHILSMADAVGGRYSLWSSVGISILLAYGEAVFLELLAGAAEMDAHVLHAPLADNLAVRHALIAVWNASALDYQTMAVVPYDQRLNLLPSYLQQLCMESLGKSVAVDGSALTDNCSAIIWGSAGTDAQHSYFQALHQGRCIVPVEFIAVCKPHHAHAEHHRFVLANMLAQSEALANGRDDADPHHQHSGDRPSTIILLESLSARALGQLLAMYEHSVYLQAVLHGINAFDQFGVELGKNIADKILPVLDPTAQSAKQDPLTQAIAEVILAKR